MWLREQREEVGPSTESLQEFLHELGLRSLSRVLPICAAISGAQRRGLMKLGRGASLFLLWLRGHEEASSRSAEKKLTVEPQLLLGDANRNSK